MNDIHLKIINIGYMFAKFFLVLFWVYLTWVILAGGEVKIMIGENGIRMGYEGVIPTIRRLITNLFLK